MFAMRRFRRLFYFFIILLTPWIGVNAQDKDSSEVALDSPKPGEAMQGLFPIIGSTSVDGFQSVELAFSYTNDPFRNLVSNP